MFVEDKQGQQNVGSGQKPNVPLTHSHKSSCPQGTVETKFKQIVAGGKGERLLKEMGDFNLSFEIGVKVSSLLLLA